MAIASVSTITSASPEGWQHGAGDYLFIRIPGVARSEWHPFTISSAPERVGGFELSARDGLQAAPDNFRHIG